MDWYPCPVSVCPLLCSPVMEIYSTLNSQNCPFLVCCVTYTTIISFNYAKRIQPRRSLPCPILMRWIIQKWTQIHMLCRLFIGPSFLQSSKRWTTFHHPQLGHSIDENTEGKISTLCSSCFCLIYSHDFVRSTLGQELLVLSPILVNVVVSLEI